MRDKSRLSTIGRHIQGQPMFKIFENVQELERAGRKILHFELGEPDFSTPNNISEAAIDAIYDGRTHYAPSTGIYDLKMAAAAATKQSRGFEPSIDQVLVTPGANSIIYLALKCLIDSGDEVIVPDPGFPTYFSAIAACGGKIVPVNIERENGFEIHPEAVREKISNKTKVVILNSPSNPTGGVTEASKILEIAKMCEEANVFLLSDEIYARLIFNDRDFYSAGSYDECRHRTIIINGFSKAFAMTGWRLGVAIGPVDVIEKMGLLVSTIVSCVPEFIQVAGVEALLGDQSQLKEMAREYENRARFLSENLNGLRNIECSMPDGAIYTFADIRKTGCTSEEFAAALLEKCGIAVTPGNFFGANGEGFIRFSNVTDIKIMKEAIQLIGERL